MTSPMRLRDSETAPRLLRLALDAPDDEPSEVELRSLAAGIGIAGIGSMPVPAPHVDATAVAAAAKATLATKAVATIGGSKILALVVGPALAGALAGTALLTTTVSMKPRPSHEVPAMTAPVQLLPQPEPVHVAPPQ